MRTGRKTIQECLRNNRVFKKPLLFGRMSYVGSGRQVEVSFTRGLTPDGFEFDFAGQAHIDGIYRSRARGRIGKSMGLAAVSDVANVLAQKEVSIME